MKKLGTILGGVFGLLLFVPAANVHPQSTILYACVTRDGTLKLVSATATCGKNETKIQWNQTGPQGAGLETGKIIGQVIGCSAMPASQTLINIRGRSFMARPDSLGQFELSYVPPGSHNVAIDFNSESVRVVTGVTVSSGQASDLGIQDICATESCIPGEVKACGRQAGVCQASTRTCPAYGQWAADCDYASFLSDFSLVEKCDGKDNNCNGVVDEDFPQKGLTCFAFNTSGQCAQGAYVCSATGGVVCSAGVGVCTP